MPNVPELPFPVKSIVAVGSRITCHPAPTNTDQDWLVLVDREVYDDARNKLAASEWIMGGSFIPVNENESPANEVFNSFVKGEDNIIITCSPEFNKRFLAASAIAQSLNLLHKQDRIMLFQAVLYGNSHPLMPVEKMRNKSDNFNEEEFL